MNANVSAKDAGIAKLVIDAAVGAVRIAESVLGALGRTEAQELGQVRERLDEIRTRILAEPDRGGPRGDWARRADERVRELEAARREGEGSDT